MADAESYAALDNLIGQLGRLDYEMSVACQALIENLEIAGELDNSRANAIRLALSAMLPYYQASPTLVARLAD